MAPLLDLLLAFNTDVSPFCFFELATQPCVAVEIAICLSDIPGSSCLHYYLAYYSLTSAFALLLFSPLFSPLLSSAPLPSLLLPKSSRHVTTQHLPWDHLRLLRCVLLVQTASLPVAATSRSHHRSMCFGHSLPQALILYNVSSAGEYTDKSSLTRTDTPSRSPGGVPLAQLEAPRLLYRGVVHVQQFTQASGIAEYKATRRIDSLRTSEPKQRGV